MEGGGSGGREMARQGRGAVGGGLKGVGARGAIARPRPAAAARFCPVAPGPAVRGAARRRGAGGAAARRRGARALWALGAQVLAPPQARRGVPASRPAPAPAPRGGRDRERSCARTLNFDLLGSAPCRPAAPRAAALLAGAAASPLLLTMLARCQRARWPLIAPRALCLRAEQGAGEVRTAGPLEANSDRGPGGPG